ncbi:MAG TPA: von Willebrand factor type A domain-containing protein, partial [Planctomycetota bacterium]|nr:von Willebrand factor type A domain-containing protein [Planctomycetota bacterium]
MQLASGSNPTATDSIDPKSEKKEEENRRGLSKDSRAGLAEGEAIKADASESRVEHDEAAEQQGDSTSPTLEDASRSITDASEGTTLEMTADPAAEAEAAKEAAARQARELVDAVLTELDRRPGETPSTMFFRHWGDNPFVEAESDPQSTFGLDVDTASYTLTRAYLFERGVLPPPEAIRTEEFVNRFDYGLAPPEEGRDFRIETNLGPSIFAHEPTYKLLAIGVRARDVEKAERKPASLVFVIDTSGSMRQENRLELVKDGLRLLVPELGEGDSVGIVAFDSEAHVILEPTSADQKERILDAIARLQPNHSTNVDAGLRAGYTMASQSRFANGTNRVLLLSDGVANTGVTVADQMLERVAEHRRQGIYLTTVGVGMGNHNDALLERLADRGNGQAIYVDRVEEARRVFVENLTGTLETVARDARIQVEFDSKKVLRYRLLGYENR